MPWFMKWVPPIVAYGTFGWLCERFDAYTTVQIGKYGTSAIGKRADTIDKAIQLNQGIEFVYTKKGQTLAMRRKIRPARIFYIKPEIINTLCVSGYCYARGADRTFLLARMSEVRPINVA